MRMLKIIEHISLDGVIQHSADDDNFPYNDWTAPYEPTPIYWRDLKRYKQLEGTQHETQ